ncbi:MULTISPECIES: hypothetical protein [Burkholderia]|uniref:hypothetical protein n=1 Tax=Burkholderia TaxID=32008 RepID=UPI0015895EB7|nr:MULTISPECIES: hypothetical protein [Burkholderia]
MSSFVVLMAAIGRRAEANIRKEEAAKHPALEKSARLLRIDMPPGTRLSLSRAGDTKSIEKAEFPHAVDVYGIPAVAMTVGTEFDDEAPHDETPTRMSEPHRLPAAASRPSPTEFLPKHSVQTPRQT